MRPILLAVFLFGCASDADRVECGAASLAGSWSNHNTGEAYVAEFFAPADGSAWHFQLDLDPVTVETVSVTIDPEPNEIAPDTTAFLSILRVRNGTDLTEIISLVEDVNEQDAHVLRAQPNLPIERSLFYYIVALTAPTSTEPGTGMVVIGPPIVFTVCP